MFFFFYFLGTGIEDEEKTVLHDLDTIYKKSTCCVPIAVITFDSCDPIKNLLGIAVSLVRRPIKLLYIFIPLYIIL